MDVTPETRHALAERMKELRALHATAQLVMADHLEIDTLLDSVARLLPPAMQYPEVSTACVRYGGQDFCTFGHEKTPWMLVSEFVTVDGVRGEVEVAYHKERPESVRGPFLAEEVALLTSIGEMLKGAIERRRAKEQQALLDERLGFALGAADMGVWEWDVITNNVTWSEQVARMTGLDVMFGTFGQYSVLVHPEDRDSVYTRLERAANGRDDLKELSFRLRRPQGGWRHMAVRARIERQPRQRATKIVAALIDVSERRALEESLRQAQKVEVLGQIASGVAHDFNNVVTVLIGNAHLLRNSLPPEVPGRGRADASRAPSGHGRSLSTQLLNFARQAIFNPSRVDVCALVERMKPLIVRIAGRPRITTVIDLDAEAGMLWADPVQIEQLIFNLVINARDAMPDGGTLEVRTNVEERANAEGDTTSYVCIEVRDTGLGIAPEAKKRLFEPFFTTKAPGKGTGLGLAVVAGTVRQWNGIIEVDSEPGIGSTFRVLFPRLP